MRSILLLMALWVSLSVGGAARPRDPVEQTQKGTVQLLVVKQEAANTADPANQLYSFQVKCTNTSDKSVRITNNQFYVLDDQGQTHLVERARSAERVELEVGKSAVLDRIYISVPRNRKLKELHLRGLGSCPLR